MTHADRDGSTSLFHRSESNDTVIAEVRSALRLVMDARTLAV